MQHHGNKPHRWKSGVLSQVQVGLHPGGGCLRWPETPDGSGPLLKKNKIHQDPCDSKGYTHTTRRSSARPGGNGAVFLCFKNRLHSAAGCPSIIGIEIQKVNGLNMFKPEGRSQTRKLGLNRTPGGMEDRGSAALRSVDSWVKQLEINTIIQVRRNVESKWDSQWSRRPLRGSHCAPRWESTATHT